MDRSAGLALALVVFGFLVGIVGFVHFAPGQQAYHHEVQEISTDRAGEIANGSAASVTNYSALSPEAHTAFEKALNDGGESTVRGSANKPVEWSYTPDDAAYSVVRYQDTHYLVVTHGSDIPTLATIGFGLSLIVGGTFAGIGIWRYRN